MIHHKGTGGRGGAHRDGMPLGATGQWGRRSLLAMFHNDTGGGEKVFQLMAKLAENPAANRDLHELNYAALCLGFEGRCRVGDGGRAQLEAVRERIAQIVANQHSPYAPTLASPAGNARPAPSPGDMGVCKALPAARRSRRYHRRDTGTAGRTMNKAFTRENEAADDDDGGDDDSIAAAPLPAGARNYITPDGYRRLREELLQLLGAERPKMVEVVSWAAKNGDRSENGDYLYGKKRLREIDRRIRFLTRRLDIAEVADPSVHHGSSQVFFGATVTYADATGAERTVTIKGIDEADSLSGEVSWISPIARALLKSHEGDEVSLQAPGGAQRIEVIAVRYPQPGELKA